MRFWRANYEWRGGYGSYEDKYYVVVAETKEVALGLVLMIEPETISRLWEITEIDNKNSGTHYINSRCS